MVRHAGPAGLARAFGMAVIASYPLLAPEEVSRRGASPVSLEQLLARSDFVSLHCPRDPTTLKMIAAVAFARMKRGAIRGW